eukprot:TRINITY_DN25073_c0_g1_i2.p2 TRINITY_DN25073_c0_g1~~TRINITY_DN25073_c0_g1_i2.p2  ORF type:complete len:196 (-),score=-20.43 TRINITY_DN25073_c0_g1_i2:1981-2568(-)
MRQHRAYCNLDFVYWVFLKSPLNTFWEQIQNSIPFAIKRRSLILKLDLIFPLMKFMQHFSCTQTLYRFGIFQCQAWYLIKSKYINLWLQVFRQQLVLFVLLSQKLKSFQLSIFCGFQFNFLRKLKIEKQNYCIACTIIQQACQVILLYFVCLINVCVCEVYQCQSCVKISMLYLQILLLCRIVCEIFLMHFFWNI